MRSIYNSRLLEASGDHKATWRVAKELVTATIYLSFNDLSFNCRAATCVNSFQHLAPDSGYFTWTNRRVTNWFNI